MKVPLKDLLVFLPILIAWAILSLVITVAIVGLAIVWWDMLWGIPDWLWNPIHESLNFWR